MGEATWRRYLRFLRSDIDADLDDELRFHFEERLDALIAGGLTSEEARLQAEYEFADLSAVRPALRQIDARVHAGRMRADRWDAWWQDVSYAARLLRRMPGFSLTVIVTLALGIGVNATLFSVLDRVFLRMPAGVARPEQVRRLYWTGLGNGDVPSAFATFSIPVANAVDDAVRGHATTTVYQKGTERFGEESERTTVVTRAGPRYFSLLGIHPAFGRLFSPDEERLDRITRIAVVSQRFWSRRFGGALADALGQTIVLGAQRYTVVGVAPRDFTGVDLDATDVWVPLGTLGEGGQGSQPPWYNEPGRLAFQLLARSVRAADAGQLESRATVGARRGFAGDKWRDTTRVVSGPLIAARGPEARDQEAAIAIRLGGVSLIVLLIACANVANLLLADTVRRRREIAVRSALGISRRGILRLFLAQSVLLAFAASGAALLVASWGGMLLRRLLFPSIHWAAGFTDWRVAGFTLAVTFATGFVAGLAPALRAAGTNVSQTLKTGGREGSVSRSRTRAALVVVQATLSTVLLVGAVLFVKSLHAVRSLDLGFDVQRLVFLSVHPPETGSVAAAAAELPHIMERLGRVPGVERVALSNMLPMYSLSFTNLYYANGDTLPHWNDGAPGVTGVSPEYFATTGMRLLRGRGFTERDVSMGGVAVVNQVLARSTWPHEDALGQCIRRTTPRAPCTTVIGVVEDARRTRLIEDPVRQVYLPLPRTGTDAWGTIIVRVPPSRAAAVELAARREVSAALPRARVEVFHMATILAPQYHPWELGATLFTIFGVLALIVAGVGVFSTLMHEIGQRRHELGVRVALGAGVIDIVRLVVGDGVRAVVIGATLGILLALGGGRLIASLLYGVAANDLSALGLVAVILIAVGTLASAIPAWRASRADPLESLRAE
jgi:putative ABC transport system permease protein